MPLVDVTTTYLELQLTTSTIVELPIGVEVIEWNNPETDAYLELYRLVGEMWGWSGRLTISEEELTEVLSNKNNHFLQIHSNYQVVGFSEMKIENNTASIEYFGCLPQCTGAGLGSTLMKSTLNYLFEKGVTKVMLHTCNYDHPKALSFYQKCGYSISKVVNEKEFYSDAFLAGN